MLNLQKLTTDQLQETYKRELGIINNKKILEKLPDKGVQLKEKIKLIKNEIDIRERVEQLEKHMSKLNIDEKLNDVDKHVKYVCTKEKDPSKQRFIPNKPIKPSDEHKAQRIPLAESMTLLKEQNKPIDKEFIVVEEKEEDEKGVTTELSDNEISDSE